MATKAVLITQINQDMFASRYKIDKYDVDTFLPIGYYLVADFDSEDTSFSLLTEENLNVSFTKGADLKHGFFDLIPK